MNAPFTVANGDKVKVNMSRFIEMAMFACIMVWFLSDDVQVIKADIQTIKETQIEIEKERVRTEERLDRLEGDMENVKKIVYTDRFTKEEIRAEAVRRGLIK